MASQAGVFNLQEFTDAGALLVGGRVYTFSYGTTTQKTAYTDADGLIPHTYTSDGLGGQYIALNARGELPAPLYLETGTYDIALKRADGSTLWTRRADGPVAGQDFTASSGSSLVGFLQAGTGATPRDMQSKGREIIGPQDYAGTDTTAFNSAITQIGSLPRQLDLAGDTLNLTGVPTPQYGAKVVNGKVLMPSLITGKTTQWNTYSDEANGIMVHRENLAAFMLLLSLGVHNVHMFGDSTVAGGGWAVLAHDLFLRALMSAGVNGSTMHNHGVGGTSWSDLNAIPYLDPAEASNGGNPTRLIVIKYGINDGAKANALSTLMTDARAKLTAIRADANGGFDSLSILLLGPNSTYNPSNGLDAKWYEDLRRCYLQLAREFDCAYLDMYAFMQDTKNAPGLWMDDLAGSGFPNEGLHPLQIAIYWYYFEAIKTHVFGEGAWSPVKSNHFWNTTPQTRLPSTATVPSAYPLGLHLELADAVYTWPANGIAITALQATNAQTCQKIHQTDKILPRTLTRTGSSLTWGPWTNNPTSLTSALLNSWVNFGAPWGDVGYVLGEDGWVTLYGTVKNGTINTAILTLPYTPLVTSEYAVNSAAISSVKVDVGGTLIHAGASNTRICLDGIRYRASGAF